MSPRLPGPPPLDPATQAAYEAQATACLAAAEQHREPLLALARKLTGNDEQGMDLFQQAVLDCHDAIQRNGFAGDRYQFYLYTSIRNRLYKQGRLAQREVLVDFQGTEGGGDAEGRDDEGSAPWAMQAQRKLAVESADRYHELAPQVDAHAELAEQVMAEVRARFDMRDRVALRLHVDGMTYRDIAALVGYRDQSWVWRRIERMRVHLQKTFRQAWQALDETTHCLLL